MMSTVRGPEFISPYAYVPWCQHQKNVTEGGESMLLWTELGIICEEILKILQFMYEKT